MTPIFSYTTNDASTIARQMEYVDERPLGKANCGCGCGTCGGKKKKLLYLAGAIVVGVVAFLIYKKYKG